MTNNPTLSPDTGAHRERDGAMESATLWQIEIWPERGHPDRLASNVLDDARELGIGRDLQVSAARGFLIQGELSQADLQRLTSTLLVEPVVERAILGPCGDPVFSNETDEQTELFYVLPLPGVTDPQAESALQAMQQMGYDVRAVRTFCKYKTSPLSDAERSIWCEKLIANESIEQVVQGPLALTRIQLGSPYAFQLNTVPLADCDSDQLMAISRDWQLNLTRVEMQTIQDHFRSLDRAPTDVELETIAQTWSEHCSHKTLTGRIEYRDDQGARQFSNLLKETVFAATVQIREQLGAEDWCVSVFRDNAGIVRFDEQNNVCFKVETHNRPSALEPYGGANTGIGGVIRDTLGTGMGAKPVCSTDVFCFAKPDTPIEALPPGVLHPRRIMKGVVAGVRDYGNRMGIPTVNGAVYFDERYVGNPLVFCGNVGILPQEHSFKQPAENDLIVVIGGRTGRDGIHGATFSSAELTESSDTTSGGAVQIGNAITEKMLMDVMLEARDRGLYNAVTDCGAGGFSSAVGEMGESIGAEVWLDQAPLKYSGLSYTEIWISESQERMVFAVPESSWPEFEEICRRESVEATVIGRFVATGRLVLKYDDHPVADLAMEFLHDGRPPVVRQAVYEPPAPQPLSVPDDRDPSALESDLLAILSQFNVASKHWIIRQYDHEVQGGSVIKPLVGIENDGPGDAAVVRPILNHYRGIAIACGMNPHFGDHDPRAMAASAIDEAIRNCVSVGANPDRIAILDNFCWGYTDRPETLGTLVRAAIACHDTAIAFGTPFISGKDSLNNEFSYTDSSGERQTISIPATLLISALGLVEDVRKCVTMDLKSAGNRVYQVGRTGDHLGGAHWSLVQGRRGGEVPTVDATAFLGLYRQIHQLISAGGVRSCHDLSEGGLAVAAAEMAFAGGWGLELDLGPARDRFGLNPTTLLFSESNGRLLVEVEPERADEFESAMGDRAVWLGTVQTDPRLVIRMGDRTVIDLSIQQLKSAWQNPLDMA